MLNPQFTVVIPAFGRGHALQRAVDSVLRQTILSLEVLVVDDHSPEPLEELLGEKDPRVRFIRLEANGGGAVARNVGVRSARGKFVAFLDSDDEWMPNKLERVATILNKAGPGKVVYHALVQCSGENHQVRPYRGLRASEAMDEYLFINDQIIQTSTIAGRRETFIGCPFDESLRRHQDWDLCLRLADSGVEFAFLPEPLAVWHHDEAGGRVSMSADVGPSIWWLGKAKLSPKARAVLELSILFDRYLIRREFSKCIKTLYRNFVNAPRLSAKKALVLPIRVLRT